MTMKPIGLASVALVRAVRMGRLASLKRGRRSNALLRLSFSVRSTRAVFVPNVFYVPREGELLVASMLATS